MDSSSPLIISISRQLGSGGSYIGQQLSSELKIHYSDREIIRKAAEKLSVPENELDSRDEKAQSFWDSFAFYNVYSSDVYVPPPVQIIPTGYDLFNAESDVIMHIARDYPSVIMGRCGFYVLRDNPNHVSIFLHGKKEFRISRVAEVYKVSEKEAAEMITRCDKDREQYIHTYTDCRWTDATLYSMSIDTSESGIDNAVKLILDYIRLRGMNGS